MENTLPEQELFRAFWRKRLSNKNEFRKFFFELLYKSEEERMGLTPVQAFDIINQLYFEMTGKLRYNNYLLFYFDRIRTDNIRRRNNPATEPT